MIVFEIFFFQRFSTDGSKVECKGHIEEVFKCLAEMFNLKKNKNKKTPVRISFQSVKKVTSRNFHLMPVIFVHSHLTCLYISFKTTIDQKYLFPFFFLLLAVSFPLELTFFLLSIQKT